MSNPYPAANLAIKYFEILREGGIIVLILSGIAQTHGPQASLDSLTAFVDAELAGRCKEMPKELLQAVRDQMDTDDFKRYLCGLLGMM